MGIFDDLTKQFGGVAGMAMKNPQAIAAVVSLLSTRDSSVGGSGGLGGLVQAFQGKGMGDMIGSWISTGPNPPISGAQVTDVLGVDTIKQFAAKAGVPHADAGGLLASLLPSVIDQLTPQGSMPEANALESALGGLLKGLGH
ncbi:MAG: YidB family protein [Acidobacteria bacterium]|nr:YidB family protein [Acidobacteriota bacterium]